jgi:hypothetical protein
MRSWAFLFCAVTLVGWSTAGFAAGKTCPRDPVCALAKDGRRATMSDSCKAADAGARVLHKGACEGGDVCSMIYTPVCATDPETGNRKTYSSLCVSEHGNAAFLHDGACSP